MYNYLTKLSYRESDNDDIYRSELLKCFNLTEKNDDINKKMDNLYETVKVYYKEIISTLKTTKKLNLFNNSSENFYFMFLFSWDYFYENHVLLKNIYLKSSNIELYRKKLIDRIVLLNK